MNKFEQFTVKDGEILVKAARMIVTDFLKAGKKSELDQEFKRKFSENAGVFVTLNDPSGLRGCIGFPMPDKKLFSALEEAAIASATEDPRFQKVNPNELNQITFEVTVLTPPILIEIQDSTEYLSKIKVGRDGLIVKNGPYSGLLLPQVPIEYKWNSEEFLSHTCIKAGLSENSWKNRETQVFRFEGLVFKEQTPNGSVVKVEL